MNDIVNYLNEVFDRYEMTAELSQLKEQLQADALERYQDYVNEGDSEAKASGRVLVVLGNLEELLKEYGAKKKDSHIDLQYSSEKGLKYDVDLNGIFGRVIAAARTPSQTIETSYPTKDSLQIETKDADILLCRGSGEFGVSLEGAANAFSIRESSSALLIRQELRHGEKVTVTVPSECSEIVVRTASGDVQVQDVETEDLNVSAASGDITFSGKANTVALRNASGDLDCHNFRDAASLVLQSASGDVDLIQEGDLGHLNASSASGDVELSLAGLLQEGEVSAVSGDVAVRLLSGSPLRIKTSTLSGTVRCRAVSDPSVPYSLKVKTVSGDIRIG
ncbi:MAG: DUF4097 family beta strand repeat protein [Erysipelotrichaceae bacterium]|nr:DUF4097 family beta strand repeat protein [Erysipelotrichaceae bacterium]